LILESEYNYPTVAAAFRNFRKPRALQTMIRFFKNRFRGNSSAAPSPDLGNLEMRVMEILWARGESSVRDVFGKIGRPLAYTTVMTTLERLFKKGLLLREKSGRAFLYSPAFSRDEWERRRAGDLVAAFLGGPQPSRELLVSSLLDAVGQHDEALLSDLEKKIRRRRKEISRRGES
jgi:predicted transcriptional regulator